MKKSQQFYMAMVAVLRCGIEEPDKLEILETLMNERKLARYAEEREEQA